MILFTPFMVARTHNNMEVNSPLWLSLSCLYGECQRYIKIHKVFWVYNQIELSIVCAQNYR